jgi:hypothetical protein
MSESEMPLSSEQEALCRRLEMTEPSAAALIREQARDIDELWIGSAAPIWPCVETSQVTSFGEDLRVKLARGLP